MFFLIYVANKRKLNFSVNLIHGTSRTIEQYIDLCNEVIKAKEKNIYNAY